MRAWDFSGTACGGLRIACVSEERTRRQNKRNELGSLQDFDVEGK